MRGGPPPQTPVRPAWALQYHCATLLGQGCQAGNPSWAWAWTSSSTQRVSSSCPVALGGRGMAQGLAVPDEQRTVLTPASPERRPGLPGPSGQNSAQAGGTGWVGCLPPCCCHTASRGLPAAPALLAREHVWVPESACPSSAHSTPGSYLPWGHRPMSRSLPQLWPLKSHPYPLPDPAPRVPLSTH